MEFEGRFIDIMEVFNVDKYEFNIKLEQIKKLAAKKEYKQAAEIAKQMNWNKVKDWSTLATIINVQEAAGDYEEARDMAILAYNRNLGGRKLIYKLTEFFIKVDDFENAEELYREYAKLSAHDVNKYILYYDLRRAQDAPDTELVDILEKYKEAEIDEKYMYELAELYYKTGRKEDCLEGFGPSTGCPKARIGFPRTRLDEELWVHLGQGLHPCDGHPAVARPRDAEEAATA